MIDCDYSIACSQFHAWGCKRRGVGFVPRVTPWNSAHLPGTAVENQIGPEMTLAPDGYGPVVTAELIRMRGAQFPLHLPKQVGELGPGCDSIEQRQVAITHLLPIDPAHRLPPVVLPLQTPSLEKHLLPLDCRQHLSANPIKTDNSRFPSDFLVAGTVVLPGHRHDPEELVGPKGQDSPIG